LIRNNDKKYDNDILYNYILWDLMVYKKKFNILLN
jgi:hypothetical protein